MTTSKANLFKHNIIKIFGEDKTYLITILLVFLLLTIISWNKWGDFLLFDNARELVVPYFLSQGLSLYNEVFYIYGPLIPYLLSLLVKIFGFKLYVFYSVGLILTFIYCFVLYFLARNFLDKLQSTVVSILFLVQLAFFNSLAFSYIFPYSFSAVFGSLLLTAMIFSLLKHYDSDNKTYLWLASIACMLTLLIKQDFFISSFAIFILYFLLIIVRKGLVEGFFKRSINTNILAKTFPLKDFIYSLAIIFVVPAIMYFFIGFKTGFSSLQKGLFPVDLFTLSDPTVEIFVRDYLKAVPTAGNIMEFFIYALLAAITIIISILTIYLFCFLHEKYGYKKLSIAILGIITITLLLVLTVNEMNYILNIIIIKGIPALKSIYSGVNLWIILLLIYCLMKIKEPKWQKIAFVSLAAIFANYRMFFNLELEFYAFYYLPLSLVVFIYLVAKFIPLTFSKNLKLADIKWKQASNIFFVILSLVYFSIVTGMYNLKTAKIQTPFGVIYTRESKVPDYEALIKAASYIKHNTKNSDKILVYPVQLIVYLLADRLPASCYYFLVAGTTSLKEDEDKVISDIQKVKPEFIVLTNEKSPYEKTSDGNYKIRTFGSKGYYESVFNCIKQNYIKVKSIYSSTKRDYNWKVDLYRLKE